MIYSFLVETTYLKICLSNETASPSRGQHNRKCWKIATTKLNNKIHQILSHYGIFFTSTRSQHFSHHHLQRRVVVFHYIHLLAEMTGFFQVSSCKQTKEKGTNIGTRKRQKLHPPNINELYQTSPESTTFVRWDMLLRERPQTAQALL